MRNSIVVQSLAVLVLVVGVYCDCTVVFWDDIFNKTGLSECDRQGDIIMKLCRIDTLTLSDAIESLDSVHCCSKPEPWAEGYDYFHANWWSSFNQNHTWSLCPPGYFLTGLYRTKTNSNLGNIEEGRCTKPLNHPPSYGRCYDQDIADCFNYSGCCGCGPQTFVVGLYRGGCDTLSCIEKLRCCTMAASP